MEATKNIRQMYRNMIRVCSLMKDPDRMETLSQIRSEFRRHSSESNQDRCTQSPED